MSRQYLCAKLRARCHVCVTLWQRSRCLSPSCPEPRSLRGEAVGVTSGKGRLWFSSVGCLHGALSQEPHALGPGFPLFTQL